MINLKEIPYISKTFKTSRDKSKNLFEENTVPYFDHYISYNKEIVSAPVYKNCDQLILPIEFEPRSGSLRSRDTLLSNTYEDTSHYLVLVTMFLNETNEELIQFFNYYRKQGVTKFFMFYNGNREQRYTALPKAEDIVYQDWDYGYWIYDLENSNLPSHHCQYQAITTGYYKYGHVARYVIVADTDEYIKHPTLTLREYLEFLNPLSHFYFREIPSFINFNEQKIYVNLQTYNKKITSSPEAGAKSIYPGPLFSEKYTFRKKVLSSLPIHADGQAKFNEDLILYHNKIPFENTNKLISNL